MRKDLVQLTEAITDGNRQGEMCWDADVGKELLARDSDERWYRNDQADTMLKTLLWSPASEIARVLAGIDLTVADPVVCGSAARMTKQQRLGQAACLLAYADALACIMINGGELEAAARLKAWIVLAEKEDLIDRLSEDRL